MSNSSWKKQIPNLIVAIIAGIIIFHCERLINDIDEKLSSINEIPVISSDIEDIQSQQDSIVEDIKQNSSDIKSLQDDLNRLYQLYEVTIIKISNTDFGDLFIEENSPAINLSESNLQSDEIIGVDIKTGVECTRDRIVNKKTLLFYEEEGYLIFFFGTYNENYNWDGQCLLNKYKNGKLVYISEDKYDNGILLSAKQVYETTAESGKLKAWGYYDKVCSKDYNSGDKWTYVKKEDYVMNFSEEEVDLSDMIYPSDFLKKISPNALEGFYHGRTSGGITNDDTGEAYKVIYDLDDGNIKLLYRGKIKDGKFNDDSGDAFEIVYSQNLGKYILYKGIFVEGSNVNAEVIDDDFSVNEIEAYIQNYKFNCPLRWKNDSL